MPSHELLLAIDDRLKVAGYELRLTSESSYAFDQTARGIREKGITHFISAIPLQEAVLPDNTPREELTDLLRYMVSNIQASDELLLIDPYLFPSNPDSDYVAYLGRVFSTAIGSIKRLDVATLPSRNRTIQADFLAMVSSVKPGVVTSFKYTCAFHDRFWIADKTRGIFVGTSLNGIGRRYALTDYLREEDAKEIHARFQALP